MGAILELARSGQQVILATHDYILLKWFDLLSSDANEDRVTYHALFKDEEGKIKVDSTNDYLAISPNAIEATFGELYKQEIDRQFKEAE